MMYSVGDVVMVREDIEEDDVCYMSDDDGFTALRFVYGMLHLRGKPVKIVSIGADGYAVEDSEGRLNDFIWNDEMFERSIELEELPDAEQLSLLYDWV